MKQVHLSYRLRLAVPTTNVGFAAYIKTKVSVCRHYKNLKRTWKNYRNAVNSAKVFSKVNPRFISVDSLTLFPDTELYQMAQEGKFIPAGEKERLMELQTFIKNLQIRTHLFANSVSNFYPTDAFLPKEREEIINELQYVIDTVSEEEMQAYRNNLHSLVLLK